MKFPTFHGTRRFITALTSVRHLSLSWASPIQSTYPHPTSWRSILIISTHLRLGLPSGLLPSGFPSKTLYTSLSSPIRATCPTHLILLEFITRCFVAHAIKNCKNAPDSLCDRFGPAELIFMKFLTERFTENQNVQQLLFWGWSGLGEGACDTLED